MGILKRYNKSIYNVSGPKIGLDLIPAETSKQAKPTLASSFNKTSLDLENSEPAGGPNNFPNNGHSQEYLPTNTFVLSPEGQVMGDGELQTTFNKTSLDLESPQPLGGPNNFPNNGHSQEYLPTNTFVLSPEGQVAGGTLKKTYDKTSLDLTNPLPLGGPINISYTTAVGESVVTSPTTQPFTPQNTYTDSFTDPRLIARTIDPIK